MADELEELDDNELIEEDEESEILEEQPETVEEDIEENKESEEDKLEKDDNDKPFPFERPSIQEIKAKYPDFFKDFPVFRDVVFQEIEYRKLFPSIEDAKESIEDNIAYQGIRESVLNGKVDVLLGAIEETSKESANKFALSFLPALHKKDSQLYSQAVTPLFENLTRTLYRSSDENTRNAALVLARYLFGKDATAIAEGQLTFAKSTEESEDAKKVREDREKFQTEKTQEFTSVAVQEMRAGMARLILRDLDPSNRMSERAKTLLVKDIIDEVDRKLAADEGHMKTMNARWARAHREGLNTASKEKVVSAYLSRAKQVIPSVRDAARKSFFGDKAREGRSLREEVNKKSASNKEVTSGRVSNNAKNVVALKSGRELYRKMSDLDILSS
jgi:hypothetical protein